MTYFAAALVRGDAGWTGRQVDLEGLEDLEAIADTLRDDGGVLSLLLLEQDDEWLGVVRVEGDEDPRVFLSDARAAQSSAVAALLWEQVETEPAEDDDEGTRAIAEPVGDAALLADVGTPAAELLGLCAEEGLLPGDVLSAVGERAGFLDVLDDLREV